MGKFFNEKNPLAGFEDYLQERNKSPKTVKDPKEFESIKTYNFLEFNYYRLKSLAKLLHKKLYNLGSEEFFQQVLTDYNNSISERRNLLVNSFNEDDSPFYKRQEEIYQHFFTRK